MGEPQKMLITPELAALWLTKNTHNRPLRRRWVDTLAGRITRGEWQYNGETFKWSTDDVFLDGQHRAAAIVQAGIAIESLVVFDLPAETQLTMDSGKVRQPGDRLTLIGYRDGRSLAAAAAWLWRYEVEQMPLKDHPSPNELLRIVQENPGLEDSLRVGQRFDNQGLRYPRSLATALHYLCARVDQVLAELFFDQVTSGLGLREGDPAYVLRRTLERDAVKSLRRAPASHIAAWTIKAWNATRESRRIHLLVWKPSANEAFPKIQ